jgi:hypothetical protein
MGTKSGGRSSRSVSPLFRLLLLCTLPSATENIIVFLSMKNLPRALF